MAKESDFSAVVNQDLTRFIAVQTLSAGFGRTSSEICKPNFKVNTDRYF